jgi:hypothetical protein
VSESPDAGLQALAPWRGDRSTAWVDLAAALLHGRAGDTAGARAHAERAAARGSAFVGIEARLLLARQEVAEGRTRAALHHAREAARKDPADARPHREAAEALRRAGDDRGACAAASAALARSLGSARAAWECAEIARHVRDPAALAELDERWRAHEAGGNAELLALQALLAERAGRLDDAERHARAALHLGASPVAVERLLRGLLARRGDFAGSVAYLLAAVPPESFAEPGNLRRDAWAEVRRAVAGAPDASAAPGRLVALARALHGLGALEEARAVAGHARSRPEAAALEERLSAALAFEAALVEGVEAGYRRAATRDDPGTLGDLLSRIGASARATLPPDEAARLSDVRTGRKGMPLLGEWLDHSVDAPAPLVAHFRAHGKHLVLGQRRGQPPEAVLLSLASLERAREIRTRGRVLRHDVAVGYDRAARSYLDFRGDDLAGACLFDGVWLDADSCRATDHALRASLARDPPPTGPRRLAPDGAGGVRSLGDGACVARRLAARWAARRPGDPWGTFRTLASHEMGHVVELKELLPVETHLPAALSLAMGVGLSPSRMEMELERRAQLAAVAESSEPDLALSELLAPLPVHARTPEAHDGGYARGAAQIVRYVERHARRFPRIDTTHRILPQLDLLSDEEIREVARAALAEGGG